MGKPKCRVCRNVFLKRTAMQVLCGRMPCTITYAVQQQEKRLRKEAKAERQRIAERKEAIKSIPQLKKEVQAAFNAYIRWRDRDQTCITCCAAWPMDWHRGGRYDAGHYRSTGSADHLRFHEDNVHGQCKSCNQHGAGKAVDYRIRLVERIGIKRVEALENDNSTVKWTRERLVYLRDFYRDKLKQEKAKASCSEQ